MYSCLRVFFGQQVRRHLDHAEQKRLQKGPADADLVDLFQVPDGVPAVVAGRHHQLGAGGQNLIPFDFQADVALLAVQTDAVESAAAAAYAAGSRRARRSAAAAAGGAFKTMSLDHGPSHGYVHIEFPFLKGRGSPIRWYVRGIRSRCWSRCW